MTRDEARRRAVDAAGKAWELAFTNYEANAPDPIETAIAAYERAMSDAGWRMVRVMPTDAMCFAGAKALENEMQAPGAVLMAIGYQAMLAEDDAGG